MSARLRLKRTTHLKPTMLDSKADIIASIILSCHLKSPVLNASSLLERLSVKDVRRTSNRLQVHRYPAFTEHDRHIA